MHKAGFATFRHNCQTWQADIQHEGKHEMDIELLRTEFSIALRRSGADMACGIPDFELAEVLVSQVEAIHIAVRQSIKQGYMRGLNDELQDNMKETTK